MHHTTHPIAAWSFDAQGRAETVVEQRGSGYLARLAYRLGTDATMCGAFEDAEIAAETMRKVAG